MDTKQAELEITLIKKMMEDSRKIIACDGKDFIVWGVLVLIGLIGTYVLESIRIYNYISWLWIIVIVVGWIYSITIHWIGKSRIRVSTLAGKIIGGIWLSCGIAMTLIGFLGMYSGALKDWGISPMMSIVLGIAYFTSGIVYANSSVKYLALGWWGGAVIMFLYPGLHILLIFAAMMVLFQIIPGIIFYIKWKNESMING